MSRMTFEHGRLPFVLGICLVAALGGCWWPWGAEDDDYDDPADADVDGDHDIEDEGGPDGDVDTSPVEDADDDDIPVTSSCTFSHEGLTCGTIEEGHGSWSLVWEGNEVALTDAAHIESGALVVLVHRDRDGVVDQSRLLYLGEELFEVLDRSEVELDDDSDVVSVLLALSAPGSDLGVPSMLHRSSAASDVGVDVEEVFDDETGQLRYQTCNRRGRFAAVFLEEEGSGVFLGPRAPYFPTIDWGELIVNETFDWTFNVAEPQCESFATSCFDEDEMVFLGSYLRLALTPGGVGLLPRLSEISQAASEYPMTMTQIVVADALEVVASIIVPLLGVTHECLELVAGDLLMDAVRETYDDIILIDDADPDLAATFNASAGHVLQFGVDTFGCAVEAVCDAALLSPSAPVAAVCEAIMKVKNIIELVAVGVDVVTSLWDASMSSVMDSMTVPLTTEPCTDPAPPEVCNGADDDGDGDVDEGFTCAVGSTRSCTYGSCGGTQTCSDSCSWRACVPDRVVSSELCDGADNDCDASTPDGADESWLGAPCDGIDLDLLSEGTWECIGGARVCTDPNDADPDVCNGVDDDGNPATADGSAESWFGDACDGADDDECLEGVYECVGGRQSCSDTTGSTAEICNGADDDCDGVIDEIGGCGGTCLPDVMDPDSDDPDGAFILPGFGVWSETLTLCSGDVGDRYWFMLPAGETVTISVSISGADVDVLLWDYDAGYDVVDYSDNSGEADEEIIYTNESGSHRRYVLDLYLYRGGDATYQIFWSF